MAELQVGSVVGGHRIEAVAGRGGMGVVYRAIHLALNRVVALKLIAPELAEDPEFRERFKRESEVAASLDHPSVVPIYTAGEDGGLLYVTMRFVDGTDLREMIARQGRLEPRVAARIISQVASALDAAHARGLVHRDVKPANVLIGGAVGTPHAYLTDFGLTKQASSKSGLTRTGMIVGTMDYIAPEQLQGGEVDARADVYALGCVLYQALTGQVPFPRDTEPARVWAHMSDPAPSRRTAAPHFPSQLDAVVARAMAKDPDDRYLSTGDFGRAAVAATEGQALSRAERSVATGEAAPSGASAVAEGAGAVPATVGPTVLGSAPTPAAGATVMGGLDATAATPPVGPPAGRIAPPYAAPAARPGTVPAAGYGAPPVAVPGAAPAPGYGAPPAGRPGPARERKSRLPLVLAVAGGVLGLILLMAVVALVAGGGGGSDVAGKIVGEPIPVGKQPYDVEVGEGFVWTANLATDTISKIDPQKRTAEQIKVGGSPAVLGVASGAVWVWNYDDKITRVDASSGQRSEPIDAGSDISNIAVGGGYVWVSHKEGTVTRINMKTRKLEGAPIKVGSKPASLAYGEDALYVANTGDNTITKVFGSTGEPLDPIKLEQKLGGVGVKDGVIYAGTAGEVTQIDEQSLTVGEKITFKGAGALEVGEGSIWVAYPLANEIRRFSADTRKPRGKPIESIGKGVSDMAVGEGALWVANTKDNSVTRVEPGDV
ncbi:MAG: protein kinase domain-containing protein [Solirubrobacteraceae bacterium]